MRLVDREQFEGHLVQPRQEELRAQALGDR